MATTEVGFGDAVGMWGLLDKDEATKLAGNFTQMAGITTTSASAPKFDASPIGAPLYVLLLQ